MKTPSDLISPVALNDLTGREAGKHILIVAGGPSGERWESVRDEVRPDAVMVINGAIQKIPDPTYFVYLDYDEPRPAWSEMARSYRNTVKIVAKPLAAVYEDGVATRTSVVEPDVRHSKTGLKMYPAAKTGTRLVGTTSMCALHLCGILGATKVTSIGVDLSFPVKANHWYPCREYGVFPTMAGEDMQPKAFVVNDKRIVTCWWFLHSGRALLHYKPELTAAGLHWTDRSCGLLDLLDTENAVEAKHG